LNILVLSDTFPPVSNAGAENIALNIAKEYLKYGHLVSIITINSKLKNGKIEKIYYEGLTVYQIGSKYNRYLIAYVSLYNPWVLKSIKSILNDNIFDFSHIHNLHSHISYGVISLLKSFEIKSILTAHDAMSIEYGKFIQGINPNDISKNPKVNKTINPFKSFMSYKRSYNPFRNMLIRYFFNKLDKVVTVSEEQEKLLNANGINNTITINNGIMPLEKKPTSEEIKRFKDKYNIKDNDKILLWAGRLSDAKGGQQIVKVMRRLISENQNVKLLIVGNTYVVNNELDKYIISTNWLDEKGMQIAYLIANITLVPSICYDMFPTVVLESMRSSTPVIATCFGGAKEVVNNEFNGYIINPFDIDNFYQKINKLLYDDVLYLKMSTESKNTFETQFTIEKCIHKYFLLIESLMK